MTADLYRWERWERDLVDSQLPIDLTRGWAEWGGGCGSTWHAWICTRLEGHSGRHAAGTGRRIVAVWP